MDIDPAPHTNSHRVEARAGQRRPGVSGALAGTLLALIALNESLYFYGDGATTRAWPPAGRHTGRAIIVRSRRDRIPPTPTRRHLIAGPQRFDLEEFVMSEASLCGCVAGGNDGPEEAVEAWVASGARRGTIPSRARRRWWGRCAFVGREVRTPTGVGVKSSPGRA